jgi:hypothetical protein
MKKYAPLATLVAVVLLGAALLVANMLSTPDAARPAAAPAAAEAPGPESAPAEQAGPTAEPAPPPVVPVITEKAYTGRSAGNEVRIAIAVKDGRAVAYACDGKKIEAWMEGTLDGDRLTLQGKSGSLAATVSEKATLGSVTVDGAEWPFAAEGVSAPAGLYEGRGILGGVTARMGWVVEKNGTVTGGANVGGEHVPAPGIDGRAPAPITVDGNVISVTPLDGSSPAVPR